MIHTMHRYTHLHTEQSFSFFTESKYSVCGDWTDFPVVISTGLFTLSYFIYLFVFVFRQGYLPTIWLEWSQKSKDSLLSEGRREESCR